MSGDEKSQLDNKLIYSMLVNQQHILDEVLRGFVSVAQEMPKLAEVGRKTKDAQDVCHNLIKKLGSNINR